jgi:hypothetical protein
MKKTLFLASALTVIFFSCSKSDTEDNNSNVGLPTSPETKQQYDNTTFGVYKGVIIGSSGHIIFRINNGDNIVKGYLSIDNQKDTLTTTETITLGQPLINVLFTGKISSMKISANADGSNASLSNIQINGHNNVTGFILHETSTKQVLCYEGNFTGSAAGIINTTRYGLNNNDTTFFLMKVQSVNDTTLYRGYGWNYNDSTRGNIFNPGSYLTQFQIKGKFIDGSNNTNTFNGTWTGNYGSGQFTSIRTY